MIKFYVIFLICTQKERERGGREEEKSRGKEGDKI